jgi:hypothetical protein
VCHHYVQNVQKLSNNTHRSQSTASMLMTSSAGKPTVSKTMTIVTSPACGIPAAPILAAVAVTLQFKPEISFGNRSNYQTATVFPNVSSTFFNCAMNIAATASYSAVPSMLMVAPTGMTNRVIRGSRPILSNVWMVIGMVAEL